METVEKISKLEEILDVEPGSITPDMNLSDIEEWDSLAALSFVVMVMDEFKRKLSGAEVRAFVTVQDVLDNMK